MIADEENNSADEILWRARAATLGIRETIESDSDEMAEAMDVVSRVDASGGTTLLTNASAATLPATNGHTNGYAAEHPAITVPTITVSNGNGWSSGSSREKSRSKTPESGISGNGNGSNANGHGR